MALFGAQRGRGRKRVEASLRANPSWRVIAQGRWVCPFCAKVALKVGDQAPHPEDVLDHFEECAGYLGGEGTERPINELHRVAAQRELRKRVKTQLVRNPSWQLIDFSQRWFCPFCGDPTNVAVPKDRKMTEETLQGIIGHVQGCYAFDRGQGKEKPFAHLKAVVKYHNQSRKLAENVRRKLEGDPAWRRKDPQGRWICPYCLDAQEHIDLSSNLLMFENAPSLIAKHLAAACEEFRRGGSPRPLPREPEGSQDVASAIPETDPHGRVRRRAPEPEPELELEQPPAGPASDRWGSVKDPAESPSGRYRTTLWGKDGVAAKIRGQRGTTLRQLEESGEFLLVDDELKHLRRSDDGADDERGGELEVPDEEPRGVKSVARWQEEIERELAQVRSLTPLGRSGEHSVLDESRSGERSPDADLATRLGLAAHGLDLCRIELRGRSPGGDFADVLELGNDRLALAAGGVSSDEGEAPLISALVRNLIRQHSAPGRCPSAVLQAVNSDMFHDLDGRSLVAVTYALIDLASGRVRLARAGLSSPVLLNPKRTPALAALDCEGMVMGIDRGPIFDGSLEVRSLELAPGDLLVLFTKGILEARGVHREEFGVYRMHRLVERYGTHELDYFVDKFKEYFGLHVQGHRSQVDGCVLGLRRG